MDVKTYEITIKPLSGFGTPLKGDTIFGHFCWQLIYDKAMSDSVLQKLFAAYEDRPFAVFSSAYPKYHADGTYRYAFRTPSLPPDQIFPMPEVKREKIIRRKEMKGRRWMIVREGTGFQSFKDLTFFDDKELIDDLRPYIGEEARKQIRRSGSLKVADFFSQPHNTINRLTNTTGDAPFAPFSLDQEVFLPDLELALFVGIDESLITIDQVKACLERIGDTGFGRDASAGLGRFQLGEDSEIDLHGMGSSQPNACYTLSPCVPGKNAFTEMYFTPFTRFGRHGDVLAKSRNPFKNPVIMADEGAVLIPEKTDIFSKSYIGRAVMGLSKVEPTTVSQGYSLYLPVRLEV